MASDFARGTVMVPLTATASLDESGRITDIHVTYRLTGPSGRPRDYQAQVPGDDDLRAVLHDVFSRTAEAEGVTLAPPRPPKD